MFFIFIIDKNVNLIYIIDEIIFIIRVIIMKKIIIVLLIKIFFNTIIFTKKLGVGGNPINERIEIYTFKGLFLLIFFIFLFFSIKMKFMLVIK